MTDASTDVLHDADPHGEDHAHPTEIQYWMVFVSLVVLTAIEVAWSYLGLEGPALVIPLVVMMVVKFLLVAGAFMHLYFDMKIINGRFFTWAFLGALVLALAVYIGVAATFEFQV
ncbi:MAG: cytochrome C oxidase subunit IV family protein [Acidimicrobiales bacterium]